MERVSDYYRLTKPGLLYGNLITTVAGYMFASQSISAGELIGLVVGSFAVMGSATVLNNYLDRDMDAAMPRTKRRATATGSVSPRAALVYAFALAVVGFTSLALFTNWLVVLLGLCALVSYVAVYSPLKRRTPHAAAIGSLPGAVPPVAGYVTATGMVDAPALILFTILAIWQLPHFYAIAMYRRNDYAVAGVPVLPLRYGERATKRLMLCLVILFTAACAGMAIVAPISWPYIILMAAACLYWLIVSARGFTARDNERWAKMMLRVSLIALLSFSLSISLNPLFV